MPIPTSIFTRADYYHAHRAARIIGRPRLAAANMLKIRGWARASKSNEMALVFARVVLDMRGLTDPLTRRLQDRALLRRGAYWLDRYKEAA